MCADWPTISQFVIGGSDMWQKFTAKARKVIFLAQEEASKLGENHVSTEHILLGLMRPEEEDSTAILALKLMNVRIQAIRSELGREIPNSEGKLDGNMQLTPRAKHVIDLAFDSARELKNDFIGTEHIMLGLIREGEGMAAKILAKHVNKDYTVSMAAIKEVQLKAGKISADAGLGGQSLLGIADLSREQLVALFDMTCKLKTKVISAADQRKILEGKTLGMIFEKPSLRTRVSFETGIFQLGGHGIYLAPADIQLGKRESIGDVAQTLGRMADIIMARVFAHSTVTELAKHARVPVINGLCDLEHPCQALADFYTILEHKGKFEDLKFAFVGDGNNVSQSLMLLAAKMGMHFSLGCPEGYDPNPDIVELAQKCAAETNSNIEITHDPIKAVSDADIVATDVWASMGQESEAAERAKVFQSFQVNAVLMGHAKPDAIFEHCLPAHRGSEVTDDVIDSPQSVVFDEAENRLHAQKAVMVLLAG